MRQSANQGNAAQQGTSIQSVERAAHLLLTVAFRKTNGSCKALAEEAGLATPTAHHLLSTLVAKGFLARNAHARYVLGPEISVLADAMQRDRAVPEYLLAPLQKLADTTGETTYLGGWRQGSIQIFAMAEGHLPVRVSLRTDGPYRDAHARATGKVLLAHASDGLRAGYLLVNPLRAVTPHTIVEPRKFSAELHKVRTVGYATEKEEFLPGVGCISVPVFHANALIGAYTMLVPVQRWSERYKELTRALLSAVKAVEHALANSSQPSITTVSGAAGGAHRLEPRSRTAARRSA